MKYKFMFDTNIFDAILDGNVPIDDLPKGYEYYVTHVQRNEINNIKNTGKIERKKCLLSLFNKLKGASLHTETSIWGVTNWGESKWRANGGLMHKISGDNIKHQSDALIAETAILNNIILVTNDEQLIQKVKKLEGAVIKFEQFMNGGFE
jgi:rRNA-processing protein FCF1